MDRLLRAVLVGGLTSAGIAATLPHDASTVVVVLLQASMLLLVCRVITRADAPSRPGWSLLAISCAAGLVAVFGVETLPEHLRGVAWTSVLALRQLTFIAGFVALLKARGGLRMDHHLLDAGMVAIGVAVCAWVSVIQPRHGIHPPQSGDALVGFTFAAMDFLLVWVIARTTITAEYRTPAMLLLGCGGLPVLITNLLAGTEIGRYGFREYQPGGSVYLAWQACGIFTAAAALSSRCESATGLISLPRQRISRGRFAILLAVALLTPTLPVAELALTGDDIPDQTLVGLVGLYILTSMLIALLVLRLANLVRHEAQRADMIDRQSTAITKQADALQEALNRQHALQDELSWRATHDQLTGLGNRGYLTERLSVILDAQGVSPNGALLLIDLDQFKDVNDSVGHHAGDQVLTQVGRRLTATASTESGYSVARLGGDEFALVITGRGPAECRRIADVVVRELADTYVLSDRHYQLTASAGLVIMAPGRSSAIDALRDADLAMYAAKRLGGNRVSEFTPSMRVDHERHLAIATGVRAAITNTGIQLAYQPIVDLTSGRTVAVEALLRCRAPSGKWFPPEEFIAVAESIGVVANVGAEVLNAAALDFAKWKFPSLSVSVNVSGRQLTSTTFADEVLATLEKCEMSSAALIVEITETVLVNASGASAVRPVRNLKKLRDNGIRVAIDDFGTGYSSLAYLQQLPIDILKLDRTFTSALDGPGGRGEDFVGAVVNLGRSLDLEMVAEGVESARQAAQLRALGCSHAQGFYYARPCSPERVVDYFRKSSVGGEIIGDGSLEHAQWR